MNRREMVSITALGAAGFITGTAFTSPGCPVSKEQGVKYAGLAIGYLKDAAPLLSALNQPQIVELVNKAIPALEKLKAALENNDLPVAGNLFDQVATILGAIATAVSNLPDSPRKITILGIIALTNLTLRVIGAAVGSETTSGVADISTVKTTPDAIKRAFEATRF